MRRDSPLLPILFAGLGMVVVLWQMLLPGYVLTLDMVFGPHPFFPALSGLSIATFLPSYFIYLAEYVVNASIVEKIILLILFYCLFYFPIKFYPFTKNGVEYFVSLLYALNPFVYERFLAGQWKVLVGYVILSPFIYFIVRFYKDSSWKSVFWAYLCLFLIILFDLHIFAIGVLILGLFSILLCLSAKIDQAVFKKRFTLAVFTLFLIVVGYVGVPYILGHQSIISTFTTSNWQAFKTASDPHFGTAGNVAALYGFWEEHEPWTATFVLPKNLGPLWLYSGGMLGLIILLGLYEGLEKRETRQISIGFFLIGLMALIFSSGIGNGVFQDSNFWLFSHVWFWDGFRDTEKWSAVLALVYALFVGMGGTSILNFFSSQRKIVLLLLCCLPMLYTPTMLFGFSGQLQPVEYPSTWNQANAILKETPNCVAVFLPWHQYYTPVFNNLVLTADTAPEYFDCTVFASKDAEIGDVGDQGENSSEYYQIEAAVTSNTANPDSVVRFLASEGIKYIIFTNDEIDDDPYKYAFLGSHLLHKVIDTPSLALFSLPL